ncbi:MULTISPECIES: HAD family acid phosphatase [Streptomyces]|uniref:HAD family acid phosphatase n=1 Tax=Streptomyces nondiastaticus TaxID=3154512 RepID=A0ABW6U5X9_9ACTN|nr:HAD family acid phosphatase [Streptomyces sp. VNUA116]WKU48647.1 HAD family acid phosphatase [Streptomyces sp. VNUA116]
MSVRKFRIAALAVLTAVVLPVATPAVAAPARTAAASGRGAPDYRTWQADVKEAVAPAVPWLRGRSAERGGKQAIVLDIDNTALETYYHPGQADKPVLEVAEWAHRHHMAVLFVTARTSSSSARQELQDAGYPVDAICTREHGESKEEGKARCRKELTRDGYVITANIGNRSTDFIGGYYEKGFKLPDYDGRLS